MSIENKIIAAMIRDIMEGKMFTSIDDLYIACKPHSQSLVERKCRSIREKGRIYFGRVYYIAIAKKEHFTGKITAYRLIEAEQSPKRISVNAFQASLI